VSPSGLLLLTGSTREGSTNTAVLRTAAEVAPAGTTSRLWPGLAELPHFDPDLDRDPLPPVVADLRAAIAEADAVLVCTPEYAGALPGSFKNLLDWTVGGSETSGRAFAWINASGRPGGAAGAHAELGTVLRYTDAAVAEEACTVIPVPRDAIRDGVVAVPALRSAVRDAVATLLRVAAGR
jgi:NAD(P)H-dependent FMN reductase